MKKNEGCLLVQAKGHEDKLFDQKSLYMYADYWMYSSQGCCNKQTLVDQFWSKLAA